LRVVQLASSKSEFPYLRVVESAISFTKFYVAVFTTRNNEGAAKIITGCTIRNALKTKLSLRIGESANSKKLKRSYYRR